jgi:hypothetical protein
MVQGLKIEDTPCPEHPIDVVHFLQKKTISYEAIEQ